LEGGACTLFDHEPQRVDGYTRRKQSLPLKGGAGVPWVSVGGVLFRLPLSPLLLPHSDHFLFETGRSTAVTFRLVVEHVVILWHDG
jgi:hypothetical protein